MNVFSVMQIMEPNNQANTFAPPLGSQILLSTRIARFHCLLERRELHYHGFQYCPVLRLKRCTPAHAEAINGVATVTGPPKSALWDGMLLESKASPELAELESVPFQMLLAVSGKAPDIADSKVFVAGL